MSTSERAFNSTASGNSIGEVRGFQEHDSRYREMIAEFKVRQQFERSFLKQEGRSFYVEAYCRVCQVKSRFKVDYVSAYSRDEDGVLLPNWRETLKCSGCGLINRVRCAVDFLINHLSMNRNSKIYLAEQLTPLCRWMRKRFPRVLGSEYLGSEYAPGKILKKWYERTGLRHEDMTQLSFPDASLDFVLSFDVMEHIPNYRLALAEKMRCLKPGGILLFTAPFAQGELATQVRARLLDSGEIEHILPPAYHGNPTKPKAGILCFYDFGWDILDDLKRAGASDASVVYCYSGQNAYWGEEQVFFLAVR